ncbi:MAG: sulfite exporter TauE/SafE family protein [Rhodothermales bacterium]
MIDDPIFYLIAIVAILISGIAKSGFGGGLGILAVPLMALRVEPGRAAAILLPILCVMDAVNIWHYRKSWDPANIKIMLPAGLLGVLIGAFTFRYLSDAHIRILIGLIAIVFSINFLRKRDADAPARGPSVARGTFWGLIAGFVSFGVHAGGPPANVYLLPQRLPKSLFVGTLVVMFTIINFVKLVPYAMLGQLSASNMSTSLILSPLAPLGVWLGLRLHAVVDERWFYPLVYAFLFMTGVKLLYDGLSGL